MSLNKKILTIVMLSAVALTAQAHDDASTTAKGPWSGDFGFGYTAYSGDTTDTNLVSGFDALYKTEKWNNTINFDSLVSSNKDGQTAERYSLAAEANFFFRENFFIFARSNNIYDKFNVYDITLNNSMGFGRRIVNTDNLTLDIQAGPGDLRQRENTSKQFNDELTFYTKETLNWTISDHATLTHYLSANIGHPNTHIEGDVALKMDVVGNWGVAISYAAFYDTYIPETATDKHKLDTLTKVTVSYSF